jgi:starvation-inducible DNA-binding protein
MKISLEDDGRRDDQIEEVMAMREIGLAANTTQVSVAAMNATLVILIDIAAAVKQAHWTIRGPNFISIHELLDELRSRLDDHVDTLAERIVALRGVPTGALQEVVEATVLPPYGIARTSVQEHLGALADRLSSIVSQARARIDETADAGDQVSADVFTEVTRGLDKDLWFLEAHLER